MPSQPFALLTKPSGSSTNLISYRSQGGCQCLPKLTYTWKKSWCLCHKRMCSCAVAYLCIFCTPEWVTGCDKRNRKQAKDRSLVCREFNWTCSLLLCEEWGLRRMDRLEAVQWTRPRQYLWCHIPFHLQSPWGLSTCWAVTAHSAGLVAD